MPEKEPEKKPATAKKAAKPKTEASKTKTKVAAKPKAKAKETKTVKAEAKKADTTKKEAPKPKAATKAKAKPKAASEITVTLKKSGIGKAKDQKATIVGLGFKRLNQTVTLKDTPSVRGMINKISHLVEVQ